MVKFARLEKFFLVVFFALIGLAVCSVFIFNLPTIATVLLLVDFVIAGFVAILASLRLREEEEEKLFK